MSTWSSSLSVSEIVIIGLLVRLKHLGIENRRIKHEHIVTRSILVVR